MLCWTMGRQSLRELALKAKEAAAEAAVVAAEAAEAATCSSKQWPR